MIGTDDDQQLAETEGSDDSDLDLTADNTDEGIDNQMPEEVEDTANDIVAAQENTEPSLDLTAENTDDGIDNQLSGSENVDTEIDNFIEEERSQIVIREDIDTAGGDIHIHAGEEGDVIISSEVSSSQQPDSEDQQAGDIKIEAERIAIVDDAVVDASGEDAGEILVGGDQQGLNEDVQNADYVYVGENAKIKADGGEEGDGGRVIVFAEGSTIVEGEITARGGTQQGDGGFIETSGLRGLRVKNAPDASATNGKAGEWLIDPYDITVSSSTDTNVNTSGATWLATAVGAIINELTLRTGLLAGDVTIATTGGGGEQGNIDFQANIDFDDADSDGTGSLTLSAHNNIYFRGNLIDSDGAYGGNNNDLTDLNLIADSDGNNSGAVYFDGPNLVGSANGTMNVEVNNDINVSGDGVFIIGSDTDDGFGAAIDSINLIADNDGDNSGDINFGTMGSPIGNDGADLISIDADQGMINLDAENINFYSNGDIDIDGGGADNAYVSIYHDGDLHFDAVNININGGSGDSAYVNIHSYTGDQSLQTSDDINFTGGGGDFSDVNVDTMGDQDVDADNFSLLGGSGDYASASLTITGGSAQHIDTIGKLTLQAGSGMDASAFIRDDSYCACSQYITALGGLDMIASSTAEVNIYAALYQEITVGSGGMSADLNMLGDSMTYGAIIESDGDQFITVHGDLIMEYGDIYSYGGGGGYNTVDVENLIVNESSIIEYEGSGMTTLTTTGTGSQIDTGTSGIFFTRGVVWDQEGEVNWNSGDIDVSIGSGSYADVYNAGAFYINSEDGPTNSGMGTFSVDASGGFYNAGLVEKDTGTGTTILNAILYNDGEFVAASGTIDFGGSGYLEQSSGATSLDGGSLSSVNDFYFYGGKLDGGVSASIVTGGQLVGDVYLQDTTVNPGHSPGTLTINGNLDASAGGNIFNLQILGITPGRYDKINVTGSVTMPATNTVNVSFGGSYEGPQVIDQTDVFPDVIQAGATSTITPIVNHPLEEGVRSTDAQVGDNLELTYTRDFFPDEPEEETGTGTDDDTTDDGMMTMDEESNTDNLPDVINLIVTITEEEREALVEAGLLDDDDDEDDDDDDKKDKPNNMCAGV